MLHHHYRTKFFSQLEMMKVYNWESAAKRKDKQNQLQPVVVLIKINPLPVSYTKLKIAKKLRWCDMVARQELH